MWGFATKAIAGTNGQKTNVVDPSQVPADYSDDEVSVDAGEEALECPICWESFNIVENVPYILWCGHTLCKNCVLGLQWASLKLSNLPVQLPFFIHCPWCNLPSLRLVYKGNLQFPRKNFFLLWMVESMNGDRLRSHSSLCEDHHPVPPLNRNLAPENQIRHVNPNRGPHSFPLEQNEPNHVERNTLRNYLGIDRLQLSLGEFLIFFFHLTSKFPLAIAFLAIVLYAIPASAVILTLYILITVLLAIPSFLVLYFAYPALDWLVREILS